MEYLRLLHRQRWILCIEIGGICISQPCIRICKNLHVNAGVLLCQNVQRIYINISVNQDYFFLRLLDNRCDQAERIIDLAIKEYLLLRFCMILNILKYLFVIFLF